MPLSAEQVAQYHRDGYVCPVPVMPAAEALGRRKQLEACEASQGGQLQAAQRSRAFLLFKWLDDLIRDPRVLDPIEQLIGPDILCWSTIFWIKNAGSKARVLAPGQHLLGPVFAQRGHRVVRDFGGERRGGLHERAAGIAPGPARNNRP